MCHTRLLLRKYCEHLSRYFWVVGVGLDLPAALTICLLQLATGAVKAEKFAWIVVALATHPLDSCIPESIGLIIVALLGDVTDSPFINVVIGRVVDFLVL